MRVKFLGLLGLAAGLAVTGFAEANLPWVYDTSARPGDVVSTASGEPAISGEGYASGDSAALEYFNSYFSEFFQIDGLSMIIYRGFILQVK